MVDDAGSLTVTAESGGKRLLGFLFFIAVAVITDGLVLALFWRWFVADTFHVQRLSVAETIGLSIIWHYLTRNLATQSDAKQVTLKRVVQSMGMRVAYIGLFLLQAVIVRAFL